jgi:hypothetical protein
LHISASLRFQCLLTADCELLFIPTFPRRSKAATRRNQSNALQ